MKTFLFACALALTPALASAQDMLPLASATIHSSPTDIASWPVTTQITRVAMDPTAGVSLDFEAKDRWPDYAVPGWDGGTIQYTVWVCIQYDGWQCAGFVQFWKGRSDTDGSNPAIIAGWKNYAYAADRWGVMAAYVPKAGDTVGLFVSAGDARGTGGVTSVKERSNVVTFQLPAGDTGVWAFTVNADPVPVPVVVVPPTPAPSPAPTPSPDLAAQVQALQTALAAATSDIATLGQRLTDLAQTVTALAAKPIPMSCSASVFGVPIHCALQ